MHGVVASCQQCKVYEYVSADIIEWMRVNGLVFSTSSTNSRWKIMNHSSIFSFVMLSNLGKFPKIDVMDGRQEWINLTFILSASEF